MSYEESARERQAHLRDYARTLWAGRWVMVAVFAVVVIIGIVATLVQTPIYRASATLEISPRTPRVVRVEDVAEIGTTGRGWSAEDRYYRTQLEVLKSRDVAERAFLSLGLEDHEIFRDARDPVGRFMARLEVEPTPETLIVTVSAEGPDAAEAAAWANAVADSYVQRNIEQASQTTEGAITSLLGQLEPLRRNLTEREKEMYTYAREKEVFVPETQKASYNERLASLEKDFTATKLSRLSLEAVFRKIGEIEAQGGDYLVIPRVDQDEILRGLIREKGETESELRKLQVVFKPGHYKIKETEAALEKLEQRIANGTERIISAIRTEYALAEAREKDLKREIERTKEEALTISEKTSAYDVLRAESENARKLYDLVAERVNEVDLNASLLRNNLTILDRARVPPSPVRPRRLLNLAVSVLMGLGLGVGLVFLLEYLDNTVRGTDQLESELGLATLAVIPRAGKRGEEAAADAFSTLRTAVRYASLEGKRRVILVTSPEPKDGKTLTALQLARAMVRSGESACLVEADLRAPDLAGRMAVPDSPGLSALAAGASTAAELVRPAGPGEPSMIPAGQGVRSPAEIFSAPRFASLVAQLRKEYDWVVLDSPPASGPPDAVLLAAQSDMVVVVARQGTTDRDTLRRAVESLRTANPNILGVVLNDVDLRLSLNRSLSYPSPPRREALEAPPVEAPRRRPAAL